jgi:HEAT repeat protein/cyclophilin family peptidyl-prolyl cis-trans isomerase
MTVRLPDLARRTVPCGMLALALVSCATAPPPPPPTISYEQKVGWILWLEDQRLLRDPNPAPPPPPAPVKSRRPVPTPAPLAVPDLLKLATDADARVRRHAALALGRVGLGEGLDALRTLLGDVDADVRQAAAFGLGVLGDARAIEAILPVVATDAAPRVRGRAAEALGLLADKQSAAGRKEPFDPRAAVVVGDLVTAMAGNAASVPADELRSPLAPEVEAFRLGLYALVRLKVYDQVARAVLDERGQPRIRWWPVAYALQRLEDPRAVPALVTLLQADGAYAAAFAARGLGRMKDVAAVEPLVAAMTKETRPAVRLRAIEALGRLGDRRAVAPLLALIDQTTTDPALRLAAITALGELKATEAYERLLDLLTDPSPAFRSASQRALAAIDPVGFVNVLSAMDVDSDWSVRASLAETLATLDSSAMQSRLLAALDDPDQRTVPVVLRALVRAKAQGVERLLTERLRSEDVTVRATAARLLGEVKAQSAAPALAATYDAAASDPTTDVREAALEALVALGTPEAKSVATRALADRDWSLRLAARAALVRLDPASTAAPERPAPVRLERATYEALAAPAVSPHVFIDTKRGTIEIELAVLDAPVTCHNFTTLARKGYFNGVRIHRVVPDFVVQDGDQRGDGTGGPGYSIRDELNDLPYLRGTLGMALSGPDTGGSQFFITHSPQPHLDGKYTVFGRVVAGMDVLDRLQQWDTIDRVRVWDGVTMSKR